MKIVNIIKNVRSLTAVSLAFLCAALTWSCEKEFEMDLELSFNQTSIELEATAGNTNIIVYSTKEWHVKFTEPASWASLTDNAGKGNGSFNLAYTANYGPKRELKIVVSTDGKEETITVTQKGIAPEFSIRSSLKISKSATSTVIPYSSNLIYNLDEIDMAEPYYIEQDNNGWITEAKLTTEHLELTTLPNNSGTERTARISFYYVDLDENEINASIEIKQLTEELTQFLIIREEIISTATGESIIDSEMLLDGIVVSDKGNLNMETNPNTGNRAIDFSVNDKTAYVQSEDGKYGFRIQFASAADNVLERYDKLQLDLWGATLVKESNPTRFTIKNVTAENIVSRSAGTPALAPAKEKYMAELTDEDLFTFVTLKDIEISNSNGAWTNVNDGYGFGSGTTNGGANPPFFDCYPLSIRDKDGSSMSMLINMKVLWRRTPSSGGYGDPAAKEVPRGSGKLSGILVHTSLPRYGNIGKYSIRPLDQNDITIAEQRANGFSEVVAEWEWDGVATGSNTSWPATNANASNTGTAELTTTMGGINISIGNNWVRKEYNTTQKGVLANTGVSAASNLWWNTTVSRGEGWLVKFSTTGINKPIYITFSAGGGSGSAASAFLPVNWHIEYSTNGTDFTAVPNSGYIVRPLVWWNNNMPQTVAPGNIDYTFMLPDEIRNKPEVSLRLVATSAVSSSDTGADNWTWDGSKTISLRLGNLSIRCNK